MDDIKFKLKLLLQSRKFWALFVAVIFAVFGARAGMTEQELLFAVASLVSYILGTALEDGLRK